MTLLAAILLAITAGLTEIFPVSGSGHIFILAKLFGVSTAGAEFLAFRGMLYLGVAFGGILFYHTQIGDMLRESFVLLGLLRPSTRQRGIPFGRRLWMLWVFASLPMLPALLLNRLRLEMEQGAHALILISGLMCLSGAVLYFAARGARGKRTIHEMTLSDAVCAGLLQTLTVYPGLSRVGFTAAILLGRGLDGPAAAEFSGLMGIPVFLAAGVVQLVSARGGGEAIDAVPYLILGFALSALTAFFILRFFTDLMARRRPTGFAYWSWGAGIFALILFLVSA